jgi:hypothetical protein
MHVFDLKFSLGEKGGMGSPALITLTMFDLCNNLKYYLYDYC